jgi:hypothetical protein
VDPVGPWESEDHEFVWKTGAIPMTWDYPEAAILADAVGGFAPA